jgi:hypothetical protein
MVSTALAIGAEGYNNTPAAKCLTVVIPAKAGIQEGTGCRIKPGMTELAV